MNRRELLKTLIVAPFAARIPTPRPFKDVGSCSQLADRLTATQARNSMANFVHSMDGAPICYMGTKHCGTSLHSQAMRDFRAQQAKVMAMRIDRQMAELLT